MTDPSDDEEAEVRRLQGRARMHDRLGKTFGLPLQYQNDRPMVVWRHEGFRCTLLRLYGSKLGWFLLGQEGEVTIPEWLKRSGLEGTTNEDGTVSFTAEAFHKKEFLAFNPRKVPVQPRTLPQSVDEWGEVRFELGCRHGVGEYRLQDLAQDVRKFYATRRRQERKVQLPPGNLDHKL